MNKIFDQTFIRFIIVGIINTLFGTSVMFISYNLLHFGYWMSSALNYIFGSVLSYFLNKYFTFKNNSKSITTVFKFIINISVCYLLAYGLAKPLVAYLLSPYSVVVKENGAMIVGMGLFVILNYFGQRFFAFRGD